MKVKKCKDCKEFKPLTEFYSAKTNRDGYSTRCKVCYKSFYYKPTESSSEELVDVNKLRENLSCDSKLDDFRLRMMQTLPRGGWQKKNIIYKKIKATAQELIEHLNNNAYGYEVGDNTLDITYIDNTPNWHYKNLILVPKIYNRTVIANKPFESKWFNIWLEQEEYWKVYWRTKLKVK